MLPPKILPIVTGNILLMNIPAQFRLARASALTPDNSIKAWFEDAKIPAGIKYMFASIEEKASMKESLWPFIIGSVIILGALTIWKFGVELFDGIG